MPENLETTQVQDAPQTTETVATQASADPFSDSSWNDNRPEVQQQQEQQKVAENKQEAATNNNEEAIDANEWLQKNFGWQNEELGKKEVEELRKFKEEAEKTPRYKLSEALKEKEDDYYTYLAEKKRIEKVEKMDISKTQDAAEILKMNLQYKNKDLTPDEIDYLFNKNFQFPKKPVQTDDMLDEDYKQVLDDWKQQTEMIERGMIIEAKIAKPEILKYKEGLTPPNIEFHPEANQTQQGPTPEELAAFEKGKTAFLNDVSKGLNDFNGFNATYKDEAVEIPISYNVTPEEKAALKPVVESLYTDWGYFVNRWANADGSFNTTKMFKDLYLLENEGKVIQKFTNETGSQVNLQRMKQKSNIQLNTEATRANVPSEQASILDKQIQAIWDA